jgi:hypothetical protein
MKLSINQLRKIISEEVRRFKINESPYDDVAPLGYSSRDDDAIVNVGVIDLQDLKSFGGDLNSFFGVGKNVEIRKVGTDTDPMSGEVTPLYQLRFRPSFGQAPGLGSDPENDPHTQVEKFINMTEDPQNSLGWYIHEMI